ncbi:phosphinothricin acetyltransferase [Hydrogenispora ethanolica]|jgi:phosphinothricin acetyltransferase|uniref:Phosphinothricin acetyltransferase n=1 Tax=Hydrogenispora ethanolica TaxID=1082276 RepID=A0A4R1R7Z7_HYDET|nr:GNAT family N-acetyltransferase [Hydrogenispora ethanolica]TCL61462.1 phosphinothricin acetyltransferase [Hydrogenispora ethanolica]
MSAVTFEELREESLPEVLAIYTHYVQNTTATFHAHALSLAEMREVVFFDSPKYQTYAIRAASGVICGYVLLTQHKKREAYDGTAEVTIYLHPDFTGQGIGGQAIAFIEKAARERNFHVLVATICGQNAASIQLFERNGFSRCAHYREVGRKFGQLLDVVAYQKIIS